MLSENGQPSLNKSNLVDWKLVEVRRQKLVFQVEYSDAYLKEAEATDQIEILLSFEGFDKGTKDQLSTVVGIPGSLITDEEVTDAATASAAMTTAIVAASLFQVILTGSLANVWALINGLQIIVHL